MQNANLKVIYEDNDILGIDKPAGISVYSEKQTAEKTLIDLILGKYPAIKNVGKTPRYGIVHRLDKDTSGVLLIAKNNQTLFFLQKEFKKRGVEKKYIALVAGIVKDNAGMIETLIGRSPKNAKKQKVYLPLEPGSAGKRTAITKYRVIKKFREYTLVEVFPQTGRKHQIRCHFNYINHPVVGDKMYGFKNRLSPKGLQRQFLHASYLKIKLPSGKIKEFRSELPEDLKKVLDNIRS